jgi:hypothetical protein
MQGAFDKLAEIRPTLAKGPEKVVHEEALSFKLTQEMISRIVDLTLKGVATNEH